VLDSCAPRGTARPPTARPRGQHRYSLQGSTHRDILPACNFQSRTRTQFMKGTELQSAGKRLPRTAVPAPRDCPFVWMFHGGSGLHCPIDFFVGGVHACGSHWRGGISGVAPLRQAARRKGWDVLAVDNFITGARRAT